MTAPGSGAAVEAALRCLGPIGQRDGALGALTTYRVGGPAAVLAAARSLTDLATIASAVAASGLPVLVVGRGSNLLVADRGFEGIAVVLDSDELATFEVRAYPPAGAAVRAGAALPLPALACRSVEAGLSGMEWAVGVPGSVGGGVRMNAGGHGSDVAASLVGCRVVDLAGDGSLRVLTPVDVDHGYRRSVIEPAEVVVDADFALGPGDPEVGRETIRDIVRWRREHQPGGQNAGSVFVNPVHMIDRPSPTSPRRSAGASRAPAAAVPSGDLPSAGWLVEAAGQKGHRIGSAEVSTKHANFIQVDPSGSADDVYALIQSVRATVAVRFGIELRTEIRMVGFHEASTSRGGLR